MIVSYMLLFFIFGLIMGSFANVCIYRIPNDKSVSTPGSYCPSCLNPIKWFDNIPVISYIILKHKCRYCNQKISIQYPLIELITAVLFSLVAWNYKFELVLPIYIYFTFSLVVISGIDYFHKIIPDIFSISLIIIGLLFSFFNVQLGLEWKSRFINSFIGVMAGGGGLLLIGYIGEKILKKEAMGGGDVKLLAGIGAVLGWEKTIAVLFVASLLGSVFSIYFIVTKKIDRKDYIPFGPFLSAAAYINIFLPNILNFLKIK